MDAATIALILQYTIKFGIPAGEAVVKLFQTPNPTQADWDRAFAASKKPLYDADVQPIVNAATNKTS